MEAHYCDLSRTLSKYGSMTSVPISLLLNLSTWSIYFPNHFQQGMAIGLGLLKEIEAGAGMLFPVLFFIASMAGLCDFNRIPETAWLTQAFMSHSPGSLEKSKIRPSAVWSRPGEDSLPAL